MDEFVKNELGKWIPNHICYWCGNFDFTGKTFGEVASHFDSCVNDPEARV